MESKTEFRINYCLQDFSGLNLAFVIFPDPQSDDVILEGAYFD